MCANKLFVVGLASVLIYLHRECEQVIHRDIKTGNVCWMRGFMWGWVILDWQISWIMIRALCQHLLLEQWDTLHLSILSMGKQLTRLMFSAIVWLYWSGLWKKANWERTKYSQNGKFGWLGLGSLYYEWFMYLA